MCDGIDPYELCIGEDAAPNIDLLPAMTHGDIVNYLVLSTSHVTLQQMKAYKSLNSHNYFTGGWVKSVAANQLALQRVIVLSEELFAGYFTRKDAPEAGTSSQKPVYCYCQGPETGKMVACDGELC
nr:uncharacterized protein LOC129384434 [Dermacentor andersoni]